MLQALIQGSSCTSDSPRTVRPQGLCKRWSHCLGCPLPAHHVAGSFSFIGLSPVASFSSERPPLPALAGRPLPHSDSMTSSCSFSSEPSDPLKSSGLCFVSSSLSLSPLEGRPQEVQDPACPAPSHSPRAGCAVDAQQGFLPPTRLSSLPPGETGLGGGVGV